MRYYLFFILIISSCSSIKSLNEEISKSQSQSIKESPFEIAKGLRKELSVQKKARKEYLGEINKILVDNPQDTVLLKEVYSYICIGCPANYVMVFYKNRLIWFESRYDTKGYERTEKVLTESLKDPNGYS